jgi:tellurite resistance protein TehA-like permease
MVGTIWKGLEFVKGGHVIMAAQTVIQQQAKRIWYFVTVQLVALLGWIVVQSTFSLSPFGQQIPFVVTMVVEAIWWAATLIIMFLMFRYIYKRFIQSVLDLEEANRRLRETTNNILMELSHKDEQGEEVGKSE